MTVVICKTKVYGMECQILCISSSTRPIGMGRKFEQGKVPRVYYLLVVFPVVYTLG